MKILRAWPANTEANKTNCTQAWREQFASNVFCTSLNQRVVVALEPVGRQPLFVAFVPVSSRANIPVGSSVEVRGGHFMLDQSMYSLPSSKFKKQFSDSTDVAQMTAIH